MRIVIPKETFAGETREAATPDSVQKLVKLGAEILFETGLGISIFTDNEAYLVSGGRLEKDVCKLFKVADCVLRVNPSTEDEISQLNPGIWHISYLDPFTDMTTVESLAKQGVTAVSMQMIPRTTLAQKMDALSSQANLGGYVAVTLAAERLEKIFPMMTTASGTISPSRVFVIGVGVAGLQAIATAKRLGARVEAYDTRPVVEEQVQSLGAKFIKIDVGETEETSGGYAKALTDTQIKMQQEAMTKLCSQSDVVITTAQVFGRKAPVLMTEAMVKAMKPGSVIVDMAAETGGNVEGSVAGEEVNVHGVTVIGLGNLPGRVAVHASQMYATNLCNFVSHFWDKETKSLQYNPEDEIMKAAVLTHGGAVVWMPK